MTRQQFDASRGPRGSLVVGSVDQVIEKILSEHDLFSNDRFLAQVSVGPMPHKQTMRAIELFGTEVAPVIRDEIARRTA
jgi:alkanesulfonate monooxygenase SsuD/methylene tetrahydromethanopterin reductase-like flavin-dependent oxidoreductase (luciferase family)